MDIAEEKLKLDRFITWVEIKYSKDNCCDECDCGCNSVHREFATEAKISDTYERFMKSRISSTSKIGQAKQAFWANLEFCQLFSEYFWMHGVLFSGDEQYYTWRWYLENILKLHSDEGGWSVDQSGQERYYEKEKTDYFLKLSRKYKTWPDPFNEPVEAW